MKEHKRGDSDLVFPGTGRGKPLSDMTLTKVIRDMHDAEVKAGRAGYLDPTQGKVATAHGFRSTFRDWVGERTNWPADLAEAALAHVIADKTVAAYERGDKFDKRRPMMEAWASLCDGAGGGNIVRLVAQ